MNANYVLTYSENTDAGDPTASVKNRFFYSKESALEAMNKDVQKTDAILHFTEMLKDDEHYISKTDTSYYVVNGCDTMRWDVNEVEVEDHPLAGIPVQKGSMTYDEAIEIQEKEGCIRRCVLLTLNELLFHSHFEGLQVFFANAVVENGAGNLTNLQYEPVDITGGVITFCVTINIDTTRQARQARYHFLLNTIIEQKVQESGMDVHEVIEELLDLGFTKEELVDEFTFDPDDVDDVADEDPDDEDPDDEDHDGEEGA